MIILLLHTWVQVQIIFCPVKLPCVCVWVVYIYMLIIDMDPLYDVGKVHSFMMIVKIVDCGWPLTSISFTMPILT